MSRSQAEIMQVLQAAIAGVTWQSESEAAFEVISWQESGTLTPQQLLTLTHHPQDAPVRVETLDSFFAGAVQEWDWHGAEERAIVAKYRHLLKTLQETLTDVTVYRVGEIEVDIYIVGQTELGNLAGVATQSIET